MDLFASYTGPDFLLFYAVMLTFAVLAGIWIVTQMRPDGHASGSLDLEKTAFLSGGRTRLAEAATAELFAADALVNASREKLIQTEDVIDRTRFSRAAQSILNGPPMINAVDAVRQVGTRAQAVDASLVRQGMLLDPAARWKLRLLAVSPYAALLALGLYRYQAGKALGEPTGFLVALMVFTCVLAAIRLATVSAHTRAGVETIEREKDKAERLRSAPMAPEAGLAVALFGTGVLVGTPFEAVHAMRQSSGDSGGSSDGSDSGCGGGGCGGCGG